jgi:hypothetical protein
MAIHSAKLASEKNTIDFLENRINRATLNYLNDWNKISKKIASRSSIRKAIRT